MKAIVKTSPGAGAEFCEVSEPRIRRGDEVLVRPILSSICGTDFHVFSWDEWSARRVRPPRIMGHEFVGKVLEVGEDVRHLKPGDLVSGESHRVCGVCLQCRTGQGHVCADTLILGVDTDGCFAERVVLPMASLWKNPPGMPLKLACIQDPLGNAVHTVLSGEIAGRSVLVLGCGPIGVMAIAVARACGATTIVATDTKPYRLELARRLGADVTVNVTEQDAEAVVSDVLPGGADVALEMSGAPSAIRTAFRATRRGGRVSLLGIPSQMVELDVAEELVMKGLEVHGIVGRRLYQTWATMSALLASGRLDVSEVITHEMSWTEYHRGMDLMREGLCGKVILHMPES